MHDFHMCVVYPFMYTCVFSFPADGIPTLDELATLNLQPSDPAHPALGNPKPYLRHRKQKINDSIYKAVVEIAQPQMDRILSMPDWNDKQDAIDDLFVHVHDSIRSRKETAGDVSDDTAKEDENEYLSVVLGSQPNFRKIVERALEKYLKEVVRHEKAQFDNDEKKEGTQVVEVLDEKDNVAEPVFMDLIKGKKSEVDENGVPKIIAPIKPHAKDGPGRMIEEWELSAKRDTKRIMCRECICEIAASMSVAGSRVYVYGREGSGKSAALTSIVASARSSGHIVLYLPDGHRLTRNGFYVEPNTHSRASGKLMFDLPILTNEVCRQLLESHEKDLEGMIVSREVLGNYLSSDQLQKLQNNLKSESKDGEYGLVDLLKVGSEDVSIGAGCYGAAINALMNQDEKTFTVVMDEFNCYFDEGHYFHEDYDPNVKYPIPLNKITLFQPLLDAVGVEKQDDGSLFTKESAPIKNGSIVVGITESHAIKRNFTAAIQTAVETAGCKLVNVPQFSPLEVEHILANFEVIGIGRLRFDRGATVMNSQEVAYLRMVSGGIGQRLLDACIY